jgi:DegV family protein with EDD domain
MPRIAFVTDSSCGLPPECVREQGIRIVPLDVIVDSDVRPDLTSAQLISALERGQKVTTSRPTPVDFLDVYQQLETEGFEAIVVTTLSSTLSGTYESAFLASKEIELPVRVVDSRNVGLGFGFAVLNASRETADLDVDTVARSISVQSAASAVYFYLDSLEYLRKGGRITATSAFIGTALSVKPILQMHNGEIAPCTKVRTQSKALARLVELALERSGPESATQFGVQHLGAPDHAQHCVDLLHAARPDAEILLSEVTAVVGAHAGPGLVAVIASGKANQGTISSTDD